MGKEMMREDDELKNESLGEEVISPREGILIQGIVFFEDVKNNLQLNSQCSRKLHKRWPKAEAD